MTRTLNTLVGLALGAAMASGGATAQAQTAPAASPAPAPAPTPAYGSPISLATAQTLIARALAAAEGRFRMAIAIVEPSGELVAFARMDDTQYGSIFVAQKKAETAARYRLATSVMEERTQAGRIVTLGNPDSLPIAGGVPIVVDGKIIGAIGVSGASAADDHLVALAALRP